MSIVKLVAIKKQYNSDQFYEGSLAKHGLTRAPGTYYNLSPAMSRSGKYITGLDSKAPYLAFLNEADRKAEVKRIDDLRTKLEGKLGMSLDANSDYYKGISTVGYLSLGDEPVLINRETPEGEVTYQWVKAHPKIAPSLEEFEAGGPDITPDMEFALIVEDEEEKIAFNNKQEINKCIAKLESTSTDKMIKWGKMLGLRIGDEMSKEKVYNTLDNFLRQGRTTTGLKTTKVFEEIVNLSDEMLQVKIIIKDGVCAAEGTYKELSSSEDEWIRSFFE